MWTFYVLLLGLLKVTLIQAQMIDGGFVPVLHEVSWGFDVLNTADFDVTVGDTIRFTWDSFQAVTIQPSLDCEDDTGLREVAPPSNGGVANYTVLPSDAAPGGKPIFFTSRVGGSILCRNGVNIQAIAFPRSNTQSPTAAPTSSPTRSIPTAQPSGSPSASPTTPLPTAAPTTPSPTRSFQPTNSPTGTPSETPSWSPTALPSSSPSVATLSPSSIPTVATETPSAVPSIATLSPSIPPTLFPSQSPTGMPSASPSSRPTTAASASPSISFAPTTPLPTSSPTLITPSPTGTLQTRTVVDLQMALFGLSSLTEEELEEWASITSIYQNFFFENRPDLVLEMETTMEVTATSGVSGDDRRHLLSRHGDIIGKESQRNLQLVDEGLLVVTYTQTMTYKQVDGNVDANDLVLIPFADPIQRATYIDVFLGAASEFSDVSLIESTTQVRFSGEITPSPTIAPEVVPTNRPVGTNEDNLERNTNNNNNDDDDNDGLSTGAIIGIVAGSLIFCLGIWYCCFSTPQYDGDDEYYEEDEDEEENPYIPPSPEAFAAKDGAIEHAFYKD